MLPSDALLGVGSSGDGSPGHVALEELISLLRTAHSFSTKGVAKGEEVPAVCAAFSADLNQVSCLTHPLLVFSPVQELGGSDK